MGFSRACLRITTRLETPHLFVRELILILRYAGTACSGLPQCAVYITHRHPDTWCQEWVVPMAEGNVKGLEKQPKRDEESDRDAASRTAPNQVSTVLMQGVLTTPRPLCFEGDGARNWRTWRQM